MRIAECLEFAWATFKAHLAAMIAVTLCIALAQAVLTSVLRYTLQWPVAAVAGTLVSGLFYGGLINAARMAARGVAPTVSDAFLPFRARQGDYLLVGLAIGSGVILCWVGVFATSCVFLFAPLLVVDGADFKQALLRSKDLVVSDLGGMVAFYTVLLVLNVLGALTVIGWLVSVPVTALAIAKGYEQLNLRLPLSEDASRSPT
jgi:hypothetical protein